MPWSPLRSRQSSSMKAPLIDKSMTHQSSDTTWLATAMQCVRNTPLTSADYADAPRRSFAAGMFNRLRPDPLRPSGTSDDVLQRSQVSKETASAVRKMSNGVLRGTHCLTDKHEQAKQERHLAAFRLAREVLWKDALAALPYPDHALERPTLPDLSAIRHIGDFIENIYGAADGMVVGGRYTSSASKKFLIDNIPVLKAAGVKTLYLEHLQTEVHQRHLDRHGRSGEMSIDLETCLDNLDYRTFLSDDLHNSTFKDVVLAFRANGIRIVALDTAASYYLEGLKFSAIELPEHRTNAIARHIIFSHCASRRIANDQYSNTGKWVALTGHSHANMFAGIPGLAERSRGVGVRILDLKDNEEECISLDPGSSLLAGPTQQQTKTDTVKSDFLIRTRGKDTTLTPALNQTGEFTIVEMPHRHFLLHRSNDGNIKQTMIDRDRAHKIKLRHPHWTPIAGTRFDNQAGLISALQTKMGMAYVPPLDVNQAMGVSNATQTI